MNELMVFENREFGQIRTIEQNGEPWFVAADVCRALELDNTATRRLDDDEKMTLRLMQGESKRTSDTNIVNEPGLYSLVLGSRKPEAKAFKRWIVHEVIPAIRKTGTYTVDKKKAEDEEIRRKLAKAKEMNAQSRQAALWLKMADKAPHSEVHQQICAAYASEALAGHKVFPLPEVEKTYTAVEVGARYGISANRVGRIANEHGMKTKEYGMYVADKAPNSLKTIETFRYNERGAAKIGEYLRNMEG